MAKYYDEYVDLCLSVCRLAYLKNHIAELDQFLCLLPMAVARSCDSVAIRYVLPVLFTAEKDSKIKRAIEKSQQMPSAVTKSR